MYCRLYAHAWKKKTACKYRRQHNIKRDRDATEARRACLFYCISSPAAQGDAPRRRGVGGVGLWQEAGWHCRNARNMYPPPRGVSPFTQTPTPPINMASEIFEFLKVFCGIRCPHFTKSMYRGIVKKESSSCVRYGALSFLKAKRL